MGRQKGLDSLTLPLSSTNLPASLLLLLQWSVHHTCHSVLARSGQLGLPKLSPGTTSTVTISKASPGDRKSVV